TDRQLPFEVRATPVVPAVRADLRHHEKVATIAALALQPDPAAVVDATRDRHLESLAVDLDDPARAVEGLLERQLGGRLDRLGSTPGRAAPAAAGCPGLHGLEAQPAQDVLA